MADVTKDQQPYIDTGTGAYDPPPGEVTVESPVDVEPTGAVEAPPAEVTVESLEHLEGPTGAHPAPAESTTRYEWPAVPPPPPKTKQVKADEVEDKAVRQPRSKGA